MERFINRQEELNTLEKEYANPASSFVVVYGRRRVGKTSLIAEFIGRHKESALYFLATEESEAQNLKAFRAQAANFAGNELLKTADAGWELVFKEIVNKKNAAKKIIVIDEFQYIGQSNPAFPSVVQKIWDTVLKEANVMLILCGSLVSLMKSQVLDYSSPLYGRRTAQIKLKQIEFKHYCDFFGNNKTAEELLPYYAVTGGVPKYIEIFREHKNIYEAIRENILTRNSFLYEEPYFLLQNEVSETGSYFSIIKSIAAGNHKPGKIATNIGIKQTSLPKYLKTLMDLDILEREVPVTENNPEKSKMSMYRIKDNFLRFWFRFVYPERWRLELDQSDYVLERIKANFIDNHVAHIYETVCRSELWRLAFAGELQFNKLGRWWNSKAEIDIVALDSTGDDIIFAECKYRNQLMDVDIFYALLDKKEYVPWKKEQRKEKFVLFSISGFTEQLQNLAAERSDLLLFGGDGNEWQL